MFMHKMRSCPPWLVEHRSSLSHPSASNSQLNEATLTSMANVFVAPPHRRRPLVDQIRQRLNVSICCWLWPAWPKQHNDRQRQRENQERCRVIENLKE